MLWNWRKERCPRFHMSKRRTQKKTLQVSHIKHNLRKLLNFVEWKYRLLKTFDSIKARTIENERNSREAFLLRYQKTKRINTNYSKYVSCDPGIR